MQEWAPQPGSQASAPEVRKPGGERVLLPCTGNRPQRLPSSIRPRRETQATLKL